MQNPGVPSIRQRVPLPAVARADEQNNIQVLTTGLIQTDVIKRRVRPKTFVFQNDAIY